MPEDVGEKGRKRRARWLQGTVDLLILEALSREPRHGYGVSSWIRERSGGELGLEDAALYQALHRLDARGLVESEWGVSENNRRAKYYRITAAGEAELREEAQLWRRYARAVLEVLEDVAAADGTSAEGAR